MARSVSSPNRFIASPASFVTFVHADSPAGARTEATHFISPVPDKVFPQLQPRLATTAIRTGHALKFALSVSSMNFLSASPASLTAFVQRTRRPAARATVRSAVEPAAPATTRDHGEPPAGIRGAVEDVATGETPPPANRSGCRQANRQRKTPRVNGGGHGGTAALTEVAWKPVEMIRQQAAEAVFLHPQGRGSACYLPRRRSMALPRILPSRFPRAGVVAGVDTDGEVDPPAGLPLPSCPISITRRAASAITLYLFVGSILNSCRSPRRTVFTSRSRRRRCGFVTGHDGPASCTML